jgi:CIC family chloride channel protein
MVVISAAVGILAGLAARLFSLLLALGTSQILDRFPQDESVYAFGAFSWVRLLAPAGMGLLCGLVLYRWLKQPTIQGTEAFVNAFHHHQGVMSLRTALIKGLASIGVISCGGSVGPEGPIAAVGGGIGSIMGRRFGLTARSVRSYLIAGCAGGVGAIFQCPLGGALFAASLMYREPDFENKALLRALICSVLAYAVYIALLPGDHRLLRDANELSMDAPVDLVWFLALGLACAAASAVLWMSIRGTAALRRRSNIPLWVWPAIGGLAVGAVACAAPQVMDWHYHLVQEALDLARASSAEDAVPINWSQLALFFTVVALAKCVATGLTLGSANAGGQLGPALFIGGITGAALGAGLRVAAPDLVSAELQAALIPIGMAGVLSASLRAPVASIVMVLEMTGSYELIVPSMLVCTTAYIAGQRFGLNDEQLRSSIVSPAHSAEPVLDLLESVRVDAVMSDPIDHLAVRSTPWPELTRRLGALDTPVLFVVRNGRLAGRIRVSELNREDMDPLFGEMVIAEDLMTPLRTVLHPSMTLLEAARRYIVGRSAILPVVDERHGGKIVGVLDRSAIHRVLRQRLADARRLAMDEERALRTVAGDEQLFHLAEGMGTQHATTIREMPTPSDLVGVSLRDSNFRRSYGLEVLGVRHPDGSQTIPADPSRPLAERDLLLVVEGSSGRA